MKKKNLFLLLILFCLMMFISGCVDAKFHVSINTDGSGDVEYSMLLEQMVLALGSENGQDPLNNLIEDAKKEGFITSNISDNDKAGFKATKHIDNLSDAIKNTKLFGGEIDKSIKPGEGLIINKSFLKTTYILNTSFDMSDLTADQQSEDTLGIATAMLQSMKFEFALTLPAKITSSNAPKIEDDGKTLVWSLAPERNNEIKVEAEAWNISNIVFLVIGILVLLTLIMLLIIRFQMRKKNNLQSNNNIDTQANQNINSENVNITIIEKIKSNSKTLILVFSSILIICVVAFGAYQLGKSSEEKTLAPNDLSKSSLSQDTTNNNTEKETDPVIQPDNTIKEQQGQENDKSQDVSDNNLSTSDKNSSASTNNISQQVKSNTANSISLDDLQGKWKIAWLTPTGLEETNTSIMTFSGTKFTEEDDRNRTTGTVSIKNNSLYFTGTKTQLSDGLKFPDNYYETIVTYSNGVLKTDNPYMKGYGRIFEKIN